MINSKQSEIRSILQLEAFLLLIYSSLNYCFLLLFSVNPSTQNPPLLITCYLLDLVIIRKIIGVNSLWFDPIATIYKFIVDCLIGLFLTASTTAYQKLAPLPGN